MPHRDDLRAQRGWHQPQRARIHRTETHRSRRPGAARRPERAGRRRPPCRRPQSMTRKLIVGAAQLGPIARSETRTQVVARLIELMREAKARGCDVVAYPELALTTFFPRWFFEDQAEIDRWFER